MYKSERQEQVGLSLNSSMISHPKPPKILEVSVLESMVKSTIINFITSIQNFTVSSMDLSYREVIFLILEEREAFQYMVGLLWIKIFQELILAQAYYLWLTVVVIQILHNFSLP